MRQVKVVVGSNARELEHQVNDFLSNKNVAILDDIKYQHSSASSNNATATYSAMIIYKPTESTEEENV